MSLHSSACCCPSPSDEAPVMCAALRCSSQPPTRALRCALEIIRMETVVVASSSPRASTRRVLSCRVLFVRRFGAVWFPPSRAPALGFDWRADRSRRGLSAVLCSARLTSPSAFPRPEEPTDIASKRVRINDNTTHTRHTRHTSNTTNMRRTQVSSTAPHSHSAAAAAAATSTRSKQRNRMHKQRTDMGSCVQH